MTTEDLKKIVNYAMQIVTFTDQLRDEMKAVPQENAISLAQKLFDSAADYFAWVNVHVQAKRGE
jgi:hypothetical protein